MSVQINCDRCGKDTEGYFRNVEASIKQGSYASVRSRDSGDPWAVGWHLCTYCAHTLKKWSQRD